MNPWYHPCCSLRTTFPFITRTGGLGLLYYSFKKHLRSALHLFLPH
ncbi:hypothetical protein BCN_2128 [Bacillus cereus NC7401]|nr:hypothetical protein BCN_2128 [Bacillus cereus NC7401]